MAQSDTFWCLSSIPQDHFHPWDYNGSTVARSPFSWNLLPARHPVVVWQTLFIYAQESRRSGPVVQPCVARWQFLGGGEVNICAVLCRTAPVRDSGQSISPLLSEVSLKYRYNNPRQKNWRHYVLQHIWICEYLNVKLEIKEDWPEYSVGRSCHFCLSWISRFELQRDRTCGVPHRGKWQGNQRTDSIQMKKKVKMLKVLSVVVAKVC